MAKKRKIVPTCTYWGNYRIETDGEQIIAGWSYGAVPIYNRTATIGIGRMIRQWSDVFGAGLNWGRPPDRRGLLPLATFAEPAAHPEYPVPQGSGIEPGALYDLDCWAENAPDSLNSRPFQAKRKFPAPIWGKHLFFKSPELTTI